MSVLQCFINILEWVAAIAFVVGAMAALACVATRMMTRSQPGHVHVSLESERNLRAGVRASRRRARRRNSSLTSVQVQAAMSAGVTSQPAAPSSSSQVTSTSASPASSEPVAQQETSLEDLRAIQENLVADLSPDTSPEQAAAPEEEAAPEEPRPQLAARQLQFPEDPLIRF